MHSIVITGAFINLLDFMAKRIYHLTELSDLWSCACQLRKQNQVIRVANENMCPLDQMFIKGLFYRLFCEESMHLEENIFGGRSSTPYTIEGRRFFSCYTASGCEPNYCCCRRSNP